MSSDTKADTAIAIKTEKSGTQIKKKDNAAAEEKSLSFKDWKSLKAKQNNDDENPKKTKVNIKSKKNANGNEFNSHAGVFNRGTNFQRPQNFVGGNDFGNCAIPPLMPPPSFNFNFPGMNFNDNNFHNFSGGRNMNNNNFNVRNMNNNNFNGRNMNNNNFNGGNMNNNNFNGRNNFPNGFNNNNLNSRNNFPNDFNNNFNGPNLPDSFFASDGIYRQKDMMQRPLWPSENPFQDDCKANELLYKLQNKKFEKPFKNNRTGDNQKGGGGVNKTQLCNKQQEAKKSNSFKPKPSAGTTQNVPKINTAPKIFVPNPQGIAGVVPYIPKPRLPNDNPDMTIEERRKAWKDYREAMKPFKNREFYNARRVVQRLSKKDPKELDEKESLRLANAKEIMTTHKGRLAAKYANYTKAEESSTGLGELYLLKKTPLKDWDKELQPMQEKQFQNYGNFGENQQNNGFAPGRKIVGGYSGFKGFVSGGMLEGNEQDIKIFY